MGSASREGAPGVRCAVMGAAPCRDLQALASKETQARVTPRGHRAPRNQQVAASIPAVNSVSGSTKHLRDLQSAFSFAGSIPETEAGPRRAAVRPARCLHKSHAHLRAHRPSGSMPFASPRAEADPVACLTESCVDQPRVAENLDKGLDRGKGRLFCGPHPSRERWMALISPQAGELAPADRALVSKALGFNQHYRL